MQTSGWDVALGLITATSAIAMPFVFVGAAKWANKQAEKVAEKVAATTVAVAEGVAKTVTDAAAKVDEKQDVIVEQGKQNHVLLNSHKAELERTIKAQARKIERLLAGKRRQPQRPKRRR